MIFQPARVESYNGYKACERPLAFRIGARRLAIDAIMARWQEAGCDPTQAPLACFRVRTSEDSVWELRWNPRTDAWTAAFCEVP